MTGSAQRTGRIAALAALMAATVLLAGCYEEMGDVHIYDPGVYKGENDPLMSKSGTEALTDPLAQRFREGQTDR